MFVLIKINAYSDMHLDNQHNLKDILNSMVDSMQWKERLNETKARQIWLEKMGTTINHYTKDINLRKGKLFITIISAPLRQELGYERDKIAAMMNGELGGSFVEEVVIR